MWQIGIDVGGTFTDLYAVNRENGEERTSKVLTTPSDRTVGVINAIKACGVGFGDISSLIHGTTTATNALLTRSYPDVAMVTTDGFRDVIEIGRMHREHLYRPYQTKPTPIIRRRYRYTIDERTSASGQVLTPIDAVKATYVIAKLRAAEVRSVAVCFLNSYANPKNEMDMAKFISDELPGVSVVTSADVKPIFREHTRFSLAAVRAVLLPVMANYFEHLENTLKSLGFSGSLMIVKSNGGMMSIAQAKNRVEELIESGPAAGVAYATELARKTNIKNIIHTDMGGTSFDVSIVEDGRALITRDYEIEFDIPVATPMLDIRSIGAGGGSVGWIDEGGSLRVGPESAGSSPGPACYGLGGTKPTITDANLVLNRLSPTLAGNMKLNFEAAHKALSTLGVKLGMTAEQCAEGMVRIATEAMAQAVKGVLTSRGRDPRDYALASFGGAGPLHAYAVSSALGIPRAICPNFSGVASAFGATVMDLRHDEETFLYGKLNTETRPRIVTALEKLKQKAMQALVDEGVAPESINYEYVLRLRYAGQTFEVDTTVTSEQIQNASVEEIAEVFHTQHQIEFGVRSNEFDIEIIAVAIAAIAENRNKFNAISNARTDASVVNNATTRMVIFDGKHLQTKVIDATALNVGVQVVGPAIIEYEHTSAVVPPGGSAFIDGQSNLVFNVSSEVTTRHEATTPTIANTVIDPITFEVLRNNFEFVCRRMSTNLQRASFSPILSENLDFSNAIYDPDLRLIGQTANCPVHLAAMHFSVQAVAAKFGISNLSEGDIVVLNDPYEGGTHLNDVTLTMPIYEEGHLIGFAVSRGHWMDLGGGGPGGQGFGTHVAGEGLRLPPMKLYKKYELNEDLLEILLRNTRTPHYVRGDLQAHLSALKVAEYELKRTSAKYGRNKLFAGMNEMIRYTERIVRAAIDAIPDGTYTGEDYADSDGVGEEKIWVRLALTVKGSDIQVDFSGSDPQCAGAINSPLANTTAAVYTALQFFLAPDAPPNAGMFAPISLKLPDNCWLNAKWPAPVVGCTTITSGKIQSAIWQAIAKAIPEKAIAPTCADANWFVAAVKDSQGNINVFSDIPAGGWGGTPFNDGLNVTLDPLGNCTNMPAEAAELLYPVEVQAFDLRADSGGAGENRGGLGARFRFKFLAGGELSMESSRTIEGSPGVNGGGNSPVQVLIKETKVGARKVIGGTEVDGTWRSPLLSSHKFADGEIFEFLSTGGGGWGNPKNRSRKRVIDDVIDGYITNEGAMRDYGVEAPSALAESNGIETTTQ